MRVAVCAALVATCATGCGAYALREYDAALDRCIRLGIRADSYDVYERCAQDADRRLCEVHGICR